MARVRCNLCRTHYNSETYVTCPICGATLSEKVAPTAGDRAKYEADVVEAAMVIDRALLAGATLTREHPTAQRLTAACHGLAQLRLGTLLR